MRFGYLKNILVANLLLVFLAACSSQDTKDANQTTKTVVAGTTGSTLNEGSASTSGTGDLSIQGGVLVSKSGSNTSTDGSIGQDGVFLAHIIYFGFDQSTVPSKYLESLNGHATFLLQNPSVKIRLEGHADERGSREYNMALGERRANSIARYLSIQGVSQDVVDVVSYGEERPINAGHDETYWSENRRVEIRYE